MYSLLLAALAVVLFPSPTTFVWALLVAGLYLPLTMTTCLWALVTIYFRVETHSSRL